MSATESSETTTERTLRLIREEWTRPYREALTEIQTIAAREWCADETSYEWYGDIAAIAEKVLGMGADGKLRHTDQSEEADG